MDPLQLLIWFIVAILVLGIIYYIMVAMKIGESLRNIVLLVALLLMLLGIFGKGRIY